MNEEEQTPQQQPPAIESENTPEPVDVPAQNPRIDRIRKTFQERGAEIVQRREAAGWRDAVIQGANEHKKNMTAEEKAQRSQNIRAGHARRIAAEMAELLGENPQEALKELLSKESIAQVAKKLGKSYGTIDRWRKGLDIESVTNDKTGARTRRQHTDLAQLEYRRSLYQKAIELGLPLTEEELKVGTKAYLAEEDRFPTLKEIGRELGFAPKKVSIIDHRARFKIEYLTGTKNPWID